MIFSGGAMDSRIVPPPAEAPTKEVPAEEVVVPQAKPAQQPRRGPVKEVPLSEVAKHEGEVVKVCGKVFGEKTFSGMTLVNVGASYPDQLLTVLLRGEPQKAWKGGDGKTLCATGKVVIYKGKPEIQITESGDLSWEK